MKEKKIADLFEQVSEEFDTPKRLNRAADYTFDEQFMEQLQEEGLTLEMIEEIQHEVPIFKYRTQVTVHGEFPETQVQRIHGYKNCFRNDNGSLGIRYNAIDVKKKLVLEEMLALVHQHKKLPLPFLRRNSSEMVFVMQSTSLDIIKEMFERINTSLFYGEKYAYKAHIPFYGIMYILKVQVGVFKKENLWPIFTNWTNGMQQEEYELLKSQVEEQKRLDKEAKAIRDKEQNESCQKNYATAMGQLAHLSKWDGNFYPNTILVSGLKNPNTVGFQFVRLQKGAFGRTKFASQNTKALVDFNPDKYAREENITWQEVKTTLEKKEWLVYQEGEKPQVQSKAASKQVAPPSRPTAPSVPLEIKGNFEYFYYKNGTALFGDTKPYKELLGINGMRGIINYGLIHPVTGKKTAGWVFSAKPQKIKEVESTFSVTCQTATTTTKAA